MIAATLPLVGGVLDGKVADIPRRRIDTVTSLFQFGETKRRQGRRSCSRVTSSSDSVHSGLRVGARYLFSGIWQLSARSAGYSGEIFSVLCNEAGLLPVQSARSNLSACGVASGISEPSRVHVCIRQCLARLATLVCISCRLILASRGGGCSR